MTTDSPNEVFDSALAQVQHKLALMAEMVSQELSDSLEAFIHRDQQEASESIASDSLIDASERIIDNLIIRSITNHQVDENECRNLVAALRISRDLERIGDYAKNIAHHSQTLDELKITGEEQRVIDMGHAVLTMLQEVIEAYATLDPVKAELARGQDVDIDELYTKIFADLLEINHGDASLASACTHLSFVARSLERIGDHITDIAEEVLYIARGEYPAEDREKADNSAHQTV
jgi:phosphate transport system protein